MGAKEVGLVNVVGIVRRPAHVVAGDEQIVEIHLPRYYGAPIVGEVEDAVASFVEMTLNDAFDCVEWMAVLQVEVTPDF